MTALGINLGVGSGVLFGVSGAPDSYVTIFGEQPFELWTADEGITLTDSAVENWTGHYNGNVLTQGSSSLRPTVTSSWKNGKPAVTSDGTQWLRCSAYHAQLTQPAFKWTVFEITDISSGVARVVHGAITSGNRMQLGSDGASPPNWAITAASTVVGDDIDDNKNYAFARFEATDILVISGTQVASGDAGNASEDGVTLFSQHTGAAIMTGHIAEHGILNRAATSQERTDLAAHLVSKYGSFPVA